MPSPLIRRMRLLAAVTLVAVALGGCASIPRTGPVGEGSDIVVEEDVVLDFLPSGPQKDADQEQTVRGFIEAATSPQGDYAIAREFLTPSYRPTWDPDVSVIVDTEASRTYQLLDDATLHLGVLPRADVDDAGTYREDDTGLPLTLPFRLEQVDGQWRISMSPMGVVVDQVTFPAVFDEYPLYFYDSTFTYLVPDMRWFPSRASTPVRIVGAVLAGPSLWLRETLQTAFPPGTALEAGTVPLVDRTAFVDLNSEAHEADALALQRMKLQLTSSLGSVSSVSQVVISIETNEQDIDVPANLAVRNPRVDPRPFIALGDTAGFLSMTGEEITQIPALSATILAVDPVAMTLSASRTVAAVQGTGGVYRVADSAAALLVDARAELIAPSLDQQGFVWSVPNDQPGQLTAFGETGQAHPVATPWPEATRIESFDISRDGTRALALLVADGQPRLVVAGIIRAEDNVPVRLGEPLVLSELQGQPIDATWVDDITVASVTRLAGGDDRILAHVVGGTSEELAAGFDAVVLVGGNGIRELRVLTADGTLQIPRGTGWQDRATGVRALGNQLGAPG